ncbi:MAG: MBL fold metallo-hydrolase [Cyclobacteriaceae bacterium]
MKVEQIYTGCLSQGAYYIESDGHAAIVDPLREIDTYIRKADSEEAKIKYIFETHFHADFVSGHVDLASRTGAQIVYGPNAKADFDFHEAADGEIFEIGKVKIKVLHTPGHTLESTTYLLIDEEGKEHAIFSGDTLFIGDVGRPDLAQKGALSQEDLAGMLFDSLRSKIMILPDDITVYPAHGAGSACGKNMSKETSDSLGSQKESNYALRSNMTRDEFVAEVTDGLLPPPQYFAQNVAMNKTKAKSLNEIMDKGSAPLNAETFESIVNHEGALVLDTRSASDYSESHIPNSIFIGIDGGFAPWVGALIPDLKQNILFIAPEGREEEVITRLSRVGYDNTLGFLEGGIETWKKSGKEVDRVESISADAFAEMYEKESLNTLDVRKPGEFQGGHLRKVSSFPLDYINDNMNQVDSTKSYAVHCAGGYRSMIAASILKSRGVQKVINIEGGFKAIEETNIPRTEFI